jgi:L-ascorbate metabolism protein UlaG (beta-lactamase superfamily)
MPTTRAQRDPRNGRFLNTPPSRQPKLGVVLTALWRERGFVKRPATPVPIVSRHAADFDAPPADALRVTWLGHSTSLVELDGSRLLLDPVWAERASPFGSIGPRRFHAPPIALDDLPPLDAVLLSHDHYDHLDRHAVRVLAARGLPFVVPTGVAARLRRWGVPDAPVREREWWQEVRIGNVRIIATPARHFSGRAWHFQDRDRSLWCGYALIGPSRRLYYAGDTSYFGGFAEVGATLGPFDATLIEIGAYSQAWPDVHIGPEAAALAVREARGGVFIPVHWGTFDLAFHGWTEPIERAIVAADLEGLPIAALRPGGQWTPSDGGRIDRWWPDLPWRTAEQYPLPASASAP